MKHLIFLFLIILIPVAVAEERVENYNDYTTLTLQFDLDSTIEAQGNDPDLDYLETELLLFPDENALQKIISQERKAEPPAIIQEESTTTFTWKEYNSLYTFHLGAEVQTKNMLYKIKPQNFPITNLPEELDQYTQPTEFIDINQDIINQASSIVAGETDLYEAVFKTAEWTKENIQYDLNTLTAKAVKKSSWVFENKEGVCDELTNLFISLLRSVGIPARFVTGTVYTNVDYSFGNHGWAEVYFPEEGWVPFDITFGQYGYLDPSHLKLMDDADSGTPSAKYSWRASNLEVIPKELQLSTKVMEKGEKIESPFTLDIKPAYFQVGSGSYVPIQIKIHNPYDSYVSTTLTMTKAPELTETNVKQIFLKPKQEKNIFWVAKIKPDLDPSLIYTSYIEVKDFFGNTAQSTLEYASSYDAITEQEAKVFIASSQEREEKEYSKDLSFHCTSNKPYYYTYETASITCTLKNIGNTLLNDISICLKDICKKENVLIGQEKEVTFSLPLVNKQTQQLIITAKNPDIDIQNTLPLQVFTEPDLRVTFLNIPKQISYGEEYALNFVLNTQVVLKDVKVIIANAVYEQPQLQGSQNIEAKIRAKDFYKKPLKITITYADENSKPYSLEKTLSIEITHAPWYAKILRFVSEIF